VSEAAAQHTAERFRDFLVRGVGFFIEGSFRGKDYAAKAEATLGSTFLNEGLLYRVRFLRRTETFQGRHLILANRA
jgi:hypothetical protein